MQRPAATQAALGMNNVSCELQRLLSVPGPAGSRSRSVDGEPRFTGGR